MTQVGGGVAKRLLYGTTGFTLLEVMIAMAIMLVSFSSILAIQSSSMNSALRSRQTHEVSMLARSAMAQTEVEITGKKFEEISEEASGQFDPPYQDYSWTRKVKEVKLPNLSGLGKAAQDAEGNSGPQTREEQDAAEQNGALIDQMTKVITNFLSKAIRQVTITVSWKRGTRTLTYEVAMYWVDLNSDFQLTP